MYHQKPLLGQQIDWSHPLAKGLVGCWVMNEGSGDKIFDLSGYGNDGTFTGSGVKWKNHVAGICVDLSVDVSSISISSSKLPNLTKGSIVQFMQYREPTVTRYTFDLETPRIILFGDASSGLNLHLAGTSFSSGSFLNAIDFFSVIGVWDSIVNKHYIYVGGVQKALNTSNVDTSATPSGDAAIGARYSDSVALDGALSYTFLYNRALTPQEITQLYIDPYCMFKPYFDPVLMAYVAAAGGLSIPVAMHLKITENIAAIGSGLKGNVIC